MFDNRCLSMICNGDPSICSKYNRVSEFRNHLAAGYTAPETIFLWHFACALHEEEAQETFENTRNNSAIYSIRYQHHALYSETQVHIVLFRPYHSYAPKGTSTLVVSFFTGLSTRSASAGNCFSDNHRENAFI